MIVRRVLRWTLIHVWLPWMARDEAFRQGVIAWLDESGVSARMEAHFTKRGY